MALKEKITQEDLILYEVLKNPVLCTEFINNYDKMEWEEPFELTDYQKEMECDFNSKVSFCCARAVGKTKSLSSIIIWILIFNVFPNNYILYSVPSLVHLQPVWDELVRMFRSNSFLKNFVRPNSGFNSSEHKITLITQVTLICRIAGQSGTGANVIGLHTPFEIIDEGGYYPWGTWSELQPTLNTFTQGFRMIVSGVPTGVREKNILYVVDQEDSNYTKHRISAFRNPRFTEKDRQDAVEQYGGEDSDEYIHLVLGQHGSPLFALFDRNLMEILPKPSVYKVSLDGIKIRDNLGDYITKLAMFPNAPDNHGVVIGIDLGYTDPTAIVILYRDMSDRLRFHGRIQLNKVSYTLQDKIIDYIDTKFKPSIIGADEGNAGKGVIQRLQEADEFLYKGFDKRLVPINFSSQVVLGYDSNGDEIKQKTKPFAVSVLQEYSNNHKLVYSSTDQEMISELERMTYSKNANGDISYRTLTQRGGKRGEDHFTAALLCATMAYYLENESLILTKGIPKLLSARWMY